MKNLTIHLTLALLTVVSSGSCKNDPSVTPDSSVKERGALKENNILYVAVYKGEASCDRCSETVKSAIEKTGIKCQVDFVGPDEEIDITENTLSHYDIYVQPGGGQNIGGAFRSLGSKRVKAIQNYVSQQGGRYLGLCMGAYLAGASYIGLIDDDLDGEVKRPGFPVKTIEDAAVVVSWLGRKQYIFFQDGPYLLPAPGDKKFLNIATYQNGDLAAARYSFGKGLVILTGPHPEANKLWFEDAELPLDKMPTDNLVNDLIAHFYK